MELWWNVPVPCQAFVVVDPNDILVRVITKCDCRGSEKDIDYWNYIFCDPLEEFHSELKVLPIPRQDMS